MTIGCGYDVGQATRQQFLADWSGKIPDAKLKALARCCGVTGQGAEKLARKLRGLVDIPWDVALEVFASHDIPRYLAICRRLLPGFDELSPDCRGVILSIAFNRDAGGFNKPGSRWSEMRQIKAAIGSGELAKIPGLIRSMKRLWPDSKGLRIRRDDEAALFEHGLAASHPHEHAKLATTPAPVDPNAVTYVQGRLRELGYYDVGQVDGEQSPQGRTEGMILAYRNARGLPLTPAIDDRLIAELGKPQAPRQVAETRASATVEDLRDEGSQTIALTDRAKRWAGKIFGSSAGLTGAGVLAWVTDRATQVSAAKDAVGGLGLTPWRDPGDRDRRRRPGRRRRRRRPDLVRCRPARAAPPG
ncbi:Peptidoglycan-binding (PGRP) domain of peptidoglycan hydrolases-containing protein [Bradyrhizobium brasilense]|uniref:Peptidoglycan-binding (PGRP) domain of peptidoglycan hydrolases-containing protein n=1 Tax=Bradyrhizobium brasilense TaxID=1419277 RepID=A0A1G7K295_9BRAD|nr:peptidoglycan-binding protein [Bradyrhizobium brasilense]SDF31247.1 Peptidoglycan-binding (PGRP) domain of peptidoglycan hydrolases-containing protein [Bradyrhizobium brasilense]